ncbi:MAG: pantetheine-phosphate adenylyltransferase [Polyangia bacterium]|nr:pantetheine-phosphate adenylyltransferase [Polyangia bacterium]
MSELPSSDRVAIYPGSFDPITSGHVDLICRALRIFDRLVVAVAVNPRKQSLFSAEERVGLIQAALGPDPRLKVTSFHGLLVDHVRELGAKTLLRGMRALADFEYEFQFAHMNKRLAPEIDTLFMITSEQNFYVSSSLVKEVAIFGGDLTGLVPPNVALALQQRFAASDLDKEDRHGA